MLVLEGLSCGGEPPLVGLDLVVNKGELPVVVCPDDAERNALVQLIHGFRPETSGRVLVGGNVVLARARSPMVAVLPRAPALSDQLTALEHIQMVASLRGVKADNALSQRVLAFARIKDGSLRPGGLSPDAQLRLTLALAVLGAQIVIALDPPPSVAAVLPEMKASDRALLWVAKTAPNNAAIGQVTVLANGRLGGSVAQVSEPVVKKARRFRIKVASGASPQSLLTHFPGVSVINTNTNSEFILDLDADVSAAVVVRALVQGGVVLDALRDGQTHLVRVPDPEGIRVESGPDR